MSNYWRPVFTLSKDEGMVGGSFKQIDAFEVTSSDTDDVSGMVRYEWGEGPDQVLSRADELRDLKEIEPNWFDIEFPVNYEEVVEMEDVLRGSGLDIESGRPDQGDEDLAEPLYRAEFYDERGVTEDMTRWRGTVPNQREFQNVFNKLEAEAKEYIFNGDI